jgi:hypothetical protein
MRDQNIYKVNENMMLLYVYKQLPLLFLCVFWKDLPKEKNPKLLCRRNSPHFICSHNPMEIFVFYQNKKEVTK